MKNKLAINLNEINWEWLLGYARLKNFKNIVSLFSLEMVTTKSEKQYKYLEPWIQWPTYYLGKSFSKHNYFHLGDADKNNKNYSIYNYFQDNEGDVLALAPMNCSFKPKNNSLLIHDPWSKKGVVNGSNFLNKFWDAICYFVNENSTNNFKINYLIYLFVGLIRFARFRNYFFYLKLLTLSIFFKWARAIFLDLLLFDVYFSLVKPGRYKYSSIFLNAGAHIQHHYLYDSLIYKSQKGKNENPTCYSSIFSKFLDPLYQIYKVYDHITYDLLRLSKKFNIEITTGLQQKENPKPYFQYRIKNFEDFFNLISIKYTHYEKKMSRDVYVFFNNKCDLESARKELYKFTINNKPLFKIWLSKKDLSMFVQVSYRGDLRALKMVKFDNQLIDFTKFFTVVSIENAIHITKGWHINNFHKFKNTEIPLKDLTKELYGFKY